MDWQQDNSFNIRFNVNACKNLSKKEIDALSNTAKKCFHFIQAFSSNLKLRNFVHIWKVDDKLQDFNYVTSGIFQLYFYENLFNPNENSKIQDQTRFNKKTLEITEWTFCSRQSGNKSGNNKTTRQHASDNNIPLTLNNMINAFLQK